MKKNVSFRRELYGDRNLGTSWGFNNDSTKRKSIVEYIIWVTVAWPKGWPMQNWVRALAVPKLPWTQESTWIHMSFAPRFSARLIGESEWTTSIRTRSCVDYSFDRNLCPTVADLLCPRIATEHMLCHQFRLPADFCVRMGCRDIGNLRQRPAD